MKKNPLGYVTSLLYVMNHVIDVGIGIVWLRWWCWCSFVFCVSAAASDVLQGRVCCLLGDGDALTLQQTIKTPQTASNTSDMCIPEHAPTPARVLWS